MLTHAVLMWLLAVQPAATDVRVLDCETFGPDLTAAQLAQRFGASNVTDGDVYVGEGTSERGTILFADSAEDRVEILWGYPPRRQWPMMVRVRGERSRWRTTGGITLGTDLETVERLNGRPFRLSGFFWDYGGTVMSWRGGRLEPKKAGACRLQMRFTPPESDRAAALAGEREFSSSHPVMRSLNPRVSEFGIGYPARAPSKRIPE